MQPYAMPGIPGTFIDESSKRLRFQRIQTPGGVTTTPNAKWYVAGNCPDGQLRVCVGYEPASKLGSLWHMSISHAAPNGFIRLPTWDEIRAARYQLIPQDVTMAMILPSNRDNGRYYIDTNPWTLQFWQVPNDWEE